MHLFGLLEGFGAKAAWQLALHVNKARPQIPHETITVVNIPGLFIVRLNYEGVFGVALATRSPVKIDNRVAFKLCCWVLKGFEAFLVTALERVEESHAIRESS